MAEYIERKPVIAEIDKAFKAFEEHDDVVRLYSNVRAAAIYAPTVDAAPVVHGRWGPCFDENHRCRWGVGKCSNCGQEYYAHAIDHYKYCPRCGAVMDGGAE